MDKIINEGLSKDDIDYIDHMEMLFNHGIKWNFKTGKGKSLEEMKEIALREGLDIHKFRKDNGYDDI